MPASVPSHERVSAPGIAFAIASYLLWGVLPLLFLALPPTGAPEIVAWRIVLSLAFCVVLLTVTGGWSRFMALVRDRVALGAVAVDFPSGAHYRAFRGAVDELRLLQTQVTFYASLRALLSAWRVFHVVLAVLLVVMITAHIGVSLFLGYTWIFR